MRSLIKRNLITVYSIYTQRTLQTPDKISGPGAIKQAYEVLKLIISRSGDFSRAEGLTLKCAKRSPNYYRNSRQGASHPKF